MRMRGCFCILAALLMSGCGGNGDTDLCPGDDTKDQPGVCGCGIPDVDSDGDGYPDCMDFCPKDATKREPGSCGCGVPDVDNNVNGIADCIETLFDLCPQDEAKTEPGTCGCGVSDVDEDGDGIPDCLQTTVDLCPDDDTKMLPGICGCGESDVDSDEDGYPDCIDVCADDAAKVLPGACGCGVSDDLLTSDTDGDGISDCFDACPENPAKWEEKWADNCGTESDLDEDGVADAEDPCPYNAAIRDGGDGMAGLELADYCTEGALGKSEFVVKSALDFLELREILKAYEGSGEPGHPCDAGVWKNTCSEDGEALVVCDKGIVAGRKCDCSQTDGGQPSCDPGSLDPGQNDRGTTLRVTVDGTINLGDVLDVRMSGGYCDGPQLAGVRLDRVELSGTNDAKIIFEKDGSRCTMKNALFSVVSLSDVSDIDLDFDVFGQARGALADEVYGSTITNVGYSGSLYSLSSKSVGGLIGYAAPVSGNDIKEAVVLTDVVSYDGSVETASAAATGGVIGELNNGEYTQNARVNLTGGVRGANNTGGLIGSITESNLHGVDNLTGHIECTSTCGGLAGYIKLGVSGSLTDIRNEAIDIHVTDSNGGGFVGSLTHTGKESRTGSIFNIFTLAHRVWGKSPAGVFGSMSGTSESDVSLNNLVSAARLFGIDGTTEAYSPMITGTVGTKMTMTPYWYGESSSSKATASTGAYSDTRIGPDNEESLKDIVETLNDQPENAEYHGRWSLQTVTIGPEGNTHDVKLPVLSLP